MLIVDRFVYEAERVAVILATARESVVVVVEALPCVLDIVIAEVLEVTVVQLACLVQETVESLKVETNASP